MNSAAMPFRTISIDSLIPSDWELAVDEREAAAMPNQLDAWDYSRTLRFTRTFDLNAATLSGDTGIDASDMSCVVIVGTGAGTLPRITDRVWQEHGLTSGRMTIDIKLPSRKLTGRIQLETLMVLRKSRVATGFAEAVFAGARLWSDKHEMTLERTESAFPMEATSFRHTFSQEPFVSAPWYLHWSDKTPDRDIRSAVRLFLNTDDARFSKPILDGDGAMLQTLWSDVTSQLVERLLHSTSDGDQNRLAESPDGSLGSFASYCLQVALPDLDEDEARRLLVERPGRFRASMLASAAWQQEEK